MACSACALVACVDASLNLTPAAMPTRCLQCRLNEYTPHSPSDDKKRRRDSSSDSPLPTKRQRLTIPPTPSKARPNKDFFFEDGDIILETHPWLFRVHSQKLREKLGGFFDDLLDLPETAEGNPTIHGVRSIKLPWVDAMDVVFLLIYIYKDMPLAKPIRLNGGEERPPPLTARVNLDCVLSLFHTSSRFNCTRLRQKSIGALSTLFRDFYTRNAPPPVVYEGTYEEEFRKTWAIRALNIFEECNVPAFLPISCYYVAQLPEEHIRDGVPLSPGNRVVKLESQKTIDSILEARKALKCYRERAWRWLSQPSDAHRPLCERQEPDEPLDTCRGVLNRVGKHLKKLGFFDEHRIDLLETLHPVAVKAIVKELCPYCSPATKKRIDATNRVTWNALPHIFGLQKWHELMAMQETYVSGEDF
ncbi:hypothetical protein IW261DRAFT_770156 [Armillaria novae-zelandiae]|uniref:BTB domain-containing protein n=1 Tax=Armillaria novae-zelandiae TaxID=153914 RepID=A0AA39PLJ4_9AGAR|nr:hypothetical protein IW261DRAFT_770156 [Armillaria novae-zelandiae]